MHDLDLRGAADPPAGPPDRGGAGGAALKRLGIAALAVAAAALVYYFVAWRAPHAPSSAPATATSAPKVDVPLAPLGGAGKPLDLPPLDASDALVRTLVAQISSSPAVVTWLTTNGLLRNFAVVVTNIADGVTPAKHLAALRPGAAFRIIARDGVPYIDSHSCERYDRIAAAVASLDAGAVASLYASLRPRIEEATRDLGATEPFDRTLERAIVVLLETPVPGEPLRLKPKGIGYAYADERLEALGGAQKQLLRMGPRNVRIIETKLHEIAIALGIPPARLPPAE